MTHCRFALAISLALLAASPSALAANGDHSKVNPVTDTIQNVIDVLKVKWNDLRGRY